LNNTKAEQDEKSKAYNQKKASLCGQQSIGRALDAKCANTSEARQAEIPAKIGLLFGNTMLLSDSIARLRERLAPVSVQVPEEIETSKPQLSPIRPNWGSVSRS
jgi:hypothetical protein